MHYITAGLGGQVTSLGPNSGAVPYGESPLNPSMLPRPLGENDDSDKYSFKDPFIL